MSAADGPPSDADAALLLEVTVTDPWWILALPDAGIDGAHAALAKHQWQRRWRLEVDGAVIAHAGVAAESDVDQGGASTPPGALWFSKLFVAPAMRGQGAARALWDLASAYAAERDRALHLCVLADSPAADAYRRWGLDVIDQTRLGSGRLALVMTAPARP